MKKIGLGVLGLLLSSVAGAAQVSVITPATGGVFSMDDTLTYMFGSRNQVTQLNLENALSSPDYLPIREATGLVDPSENGGEELVWLGVHESTGSGANNKIAVELNSTHGDMTGGVSLVLAAAQALEWDLMFDTSLVKLNNIFVFSASELGQTITINGQSLLPVATDQMLGDVSVKRSSSGYCGYLLPQDDQGCFTDLILGIDQFGLDEFGDETHTNENGEENALDLLTDYNVTSFNGSYLASAFKIDIDSRTAVVPLPGAAMLFMSCLVAFFPMTKFSKH